MVQYQSLAERELATCIDLARLSKIDIDANYRVGVQYNTNRMANENMAFG